MYVSNIGPFTVKRLAMLMLLSAVLTLQGCNLFGPRLKPPMPSAAVMADCGLMPDLGGDTLADVYIWGIGLMEYGENCADLNDAKAKAILEITDG